MTHASPAMIAQVAGEPPRFPLNWAALGFLLTLLLQAAAAVFWAGALQAQAADTNRRLAALEQQTQGLIEMRATVARIDERTVNMQRELARADR